MKAVERVKAKEAEAQAADTVEAFARRWYSEIAEPVNSNPRNIKRVLEKDVIPAIGAKQIVDVTVTDILTITDRIKNRGADQMALHLLILCMVRKSELTQARWEEIDLERAAWSIPGERMKKDKPHFVPLSRQAVAMFEELKGLASGSEWVLPSRGSLKKPIAHNALNTVVRALETDVRDFVIHDFRRTASTHLHETGFNSDWIEKALAHETRGIRGVYNRAQYADQRREMLQMVG